METLQTPYPDTLLALETLEEQLKCLICSQIANSPCTLGGCEHIFCSTCCTDYLGRSCPVCEIPAHVKDAEVDRQLFNMVNLCRKLRAVLTCQDEPEPDRQENQQGATSENSLLHPRQSESNIKKTNQKSSALSKSHDGHVTAVTPVKSTSCDIKDKGKSGKKGQKKNVGMKNSASEQTTMTQFYEYEEEEINGGLEIADILDSGKAINNGNAVGHKGNETFDSDKQGDAGKGRKTRRSVSCSRKFSKAGERNSLSEALVNQTTTRLRKKPLNTTKMADKMVNDAEDNNTLDGKNKSSPSKPKSSAVSKMETTPVLKRSRSKVNTASPLSQQQKTPATASRSKSKRVSSSYSPLSNHKTTPRATTSRSKSGSVSPFLTPGSRSQETCSSSAPCTTPQRSVTMSKSVSASPALNKRNAKGETPLHVAAIKNDVDRVTSLLLAGANPNVRDNAGWTPLHEACNHGYTDVARLLLDNGAMVNIPGLENDSPLHDAVTNNRPQCVQLLVSRGASLTVRNLHGLTPMDLAKTDLIREMLLTPINDSVIVKDSQPLDTLEYQHPCLMGTSLSREQKQVLQKCAALLQAKIVEDCTPEVTHVITSCNKDGMCPRTVKYLQSVLSGKWILTMEWVDTCLQLGTRVCEEGFEVQGTSTCPNSGAPYKGRMNRKQQLPGLFDGCQFYFHGDFTYPTPEKESLVEIVKAGAGRIMYREPKLDHIDDDSLTVPYHAVSGGKLEQCGIYVIHDTALKFEPIRKEKIRSMTASWIMDCAAEFQLLDPSQ